jgi:hypothetical protein
MLINWGLEAKKWQWCNRSLQSIPYGMAIKAVFTGIAIASLTPNRVGEYFGRMLYIDEGKRIQSVSLTVVGSMAQMLVTLLCGSMGIFYLQWYLLRHAVAGHPYLHISLQLLAVGMILGMVLLLLFYFRLGWFVSWVQKWDLKQRYLTYVKILKDLPAPVLLRILLLSFVRYLVFIIQYGLLFAAFGVELSWPQLAGGISVMFLVMALVPTITFLTDLGLRWEASIQIMELFSANMVGIFAASLGIWLVNLIVPALIGSLLILRIKIFDIR